MSERETQRHLLRCSRVVSPHRGRCSELSASLTLSRGSRSARAALVFLYGSVVHASTVVGQGSLPIIAGRTGAARDGGRNPTRGMWSLAADFTDRLLPRGSWKRYHIIIPSHADFTRDQFIAEFFRFVWR